jgi:hypothetical protein
MKVNVEDGKEKEINSVKKIVNVIHDTINQTYIEESYVEMEIQGKTLIWKDWMDYNKFKELNPDVEI